MKARAEEIKKPQEGEESVELAVASELRLPLSSLMKSHVVSRCSHSFAV